LLFKSLALIQMFYHYLFPAVQPFALDFLSVAMIVTGYVISIMATNALGIDRTYFAAELGLVEPKWIDQFPYGFLPLLPSSLLLRPDLTIPFSVRYIPHPMIVSQILALLGLYKAAHFRTEWPYVVPIHITMYLIHMAQEQFDIYKRYPESATASSSSSSSSSTTTTVKQ
jgi:hypothetical protein